VALRYFSLRLVKEIQLETVDLKQGYEYGTKILEFMHSAQSKQ